MGCINCRVEEVCFHKMNASDHSQHQGKLQKNGESEVMTIHISISDVASKNTVRGLRLHYHSLFFLPYVNVIWKFCTAFYAFEKD